MKHLYISPSWRETEINVDNTSIGVTGTGKLHISFIGHEGTYTLVLSADEWGKLSKDAQLIINNK